MNRVLQIVGGGVRHFGSSSIACKKVPSQIKKTSSSSVGWVTRQLNDAYVKRARMENYRCRSAFKLIQIDDRYKILRPGDTVVDCGAAPGAWTQVATARINARNIDDNLPVGKVIAVDLSYVSPIEGATIISHADFTLPETQQKVLDYLQGKRVDVVLSDMANNASGVNSLDNEIITHLATSALIFALRNLRMGGQFLCKVWQGAEDQKLEQHMKTYFDTVNRVKPDSSRANSAEIFILGRGFKGVTNLDETS